MKKILATISAMLLIASAANAQSGLLGSLGKIFGGGKTESTENTGNAAGSVASAAGSILESVLGTVISQTVNVSLPGTWTYAGVASAIQTENTLTTLAASAYKEKLEAKLDGYLQRVGIVPGVATIAFTADGGFAIASGNKTIAAGTYTYENKVIVMKFGKVYNFLTMEGTVTASTNGAQVLFEAGKFLEFAKKAIKVVGAKSSNSTYNNIASVINEISGLKLGFDMKK